VGRRERKSSEESGFKEAVQFAQWCFLIVETTRKARDRARLLYHFSDISVAEIQPYTSRLAGSCLGPIVSLTSLYWRIWIMNKISAVSQFKH